MAISGGPSKPIKIIFQAIGCSGMKDLLIIQMHIGSIGKKWSLFAIVIYFILNFEMLNYWRRNERINITAVNLQSFYTDGGMNLIKKFKLYVEDNWNKCDMLAISLFIIGIACRYVASGVSPPPSAFFLKDDITGNKRWDDTVLRKKS